MTKPLWTLGNMILGGVAGYLMSTGRKPEGLVIFIAIIVLTISKIE